MGTKPWRTENILRNQERREQGDLFIVKIIINIRTQEKNQWKSIIIGDEGCGLAEIWKITQKKFQP